MSFVLMMLKWFPHILAVVKVLEEIIPIPDSGKAKLKLVIDVITALMRLKPDATPQDAVEMMVEKSVKTLNDTGAFAHTAPVAGKK